MKKKTYNIVSCGVMTALIAVLSLISIPLPSGVPITLQTFVIALAGFFLGSGFSAVSVAAYIVIGAIGLPVFSGFKGGLSVLTGYTGGFILGFILLAALCGLKRDKLWLNLIFAVIGLALCHFCGTLQYMFLANMEFIPAFLLVSSPYLIKDIISIGIAKWIAVIMLKATDKIKKS